MSKKDPITTTIAWYSNSFETYKTMRSDLSRDQENREYFLKHIPGKKILDIWCAHGRDVCEFFKRWIDITWIDLTPEFVKLAKENCPEADIQLMDMRKLTFKDKTFDGIRACASFLHIPKEEAEKTLQEFFRVLKKEWLLFMGVMEGNGEGYDKRSKYKNVERFFSYRKQEELGAVLENVGFSIQKSYTATLPGSDSIWLSIFATAK